MEAHNKAVSRVSSRVKEFHSQQKPFRLYHGSTNSTRASDRSAANIVDTSGLTHILSVDRDAKVALVEPNVPLDALVARTLPQGLVPPVVMELPGITVGGGFAGTSGESSSFKWGAFDMTVSEIEVVLPDGEVVRASRTEREDLFWGSASAFGTLGVITLLEVRLVEAKKYVALRYRRVSSAKDTVSTIEEECKNEENDYIDGIVYSKDSTVICAGRLTDELPEGQKPRTFLRRQDPWFYLRVQDVEKKLQKTPDAEIIDYIPLADYLFRYDRGGFWVARYAFRYFLTPFNRITRYALDRFMHAREMYRALHKSGLADYYMVQDVGVPVSAGPEFQAWLDETLNIYPLWLCPLRIRRDGPSVSSAGHGIHAKFADPATSPDLLNFGVWGPVSGSRDRVVRQNRQLEAKVRELGGYKWLYAQAFYTEDEFWAIYDRGSYEALREKYHAGYLPSVYDKIKTDLAKEEEARSGTLGRRAKTKVWGVWPLRGLYGVYKSAVGGDYLLQKKRKEEAGAGSGEKRPGQTKA